MRLKLILRWAFVLPFVFIPAIRTHAQVVASATERTLPLAVGGGLSGFDPDVYQDQGYDTYIWKTYGSGHMLGASAWADYFPGWMPRRLHGLGIEAEARQISWHRGVGEEHIRMRNAGGGAIYSWRHFRDFRPYAKGGMDIGWIDFAPMGHYKDGRPYKSDSRSLAYVGGGLEYRVWRHVWVRADYEYQRWHSLFGHDGIAPQGVTLGATYRFGRVRTR